MKKKIFLIVGIIIVGTFLLFAPIVTTSEDSPKLTLVEFAFSVLGTSEGVDPLLEGVEEPMPTSHIIGTFCDSDFDSDSNIMTDTSCLQFQTETNGVVTINDDRYLAFALKGTVGETEYTYTSMDFDWTWHTEEDGGDYTFWAENNNPNFIWRQYYHFYESQSKPMKIEHYLENNWADITDAQMYYLTNVMPTDEIEYNNTKYLVSDYMGLHKQGNLTDVISNINFNAEYDFLFEDIIEDEFEINEFYIGSGSVIDKPSTDIMAIGFTKNDGNFPQGTSVLVDPTFSTGDIETIALSPLDENTFVIAYCDEVDNYIKFTIYNTDGTISVSETVADDDIGICSDYGSHVSVSTLNSTHFAIAYYDNTDDNVSFVVFDSSGNNVTGVNASAIDVDFIASGNYVSVSAFNSTHIVIMYHEYASKDVFFVTYDVSGIEIVSPVTVDVNAGSTSSEGSVSTFNSTHFVLSWNDVTSLDVTFRIYGVDGTLLKSDVYADDNVGNNGYNSVATLNDTYFAITWFDDGDNIMEYSVYDSLGNLKTGPTTIADASHLSSSMLSISAMDEDTFVVGWYDYTDGAHAFAVYDSDGTEIVGETAMHLTTEKFNDITSYSAPVNIGFSNNRFVFAGTTSGTEANWTYYNSDGSVWTVDTTKSTFSNNATNETFAGKPVNFTIDVTDNENLDNTAGYIFSTNNTGTWANSSFSYFVGSGLTLTAWNQTILNSTIGLEVQWKFYANDSSTGTAGGNWNVSTTYNLTTTTNVAPTVSNLTEPADPTTYSYGGTYPFNATFCDYDGLGDIDEVYFEWDGTNSSNITTTTAINSTCAVFLTSKVDEPAQTSTSYKWYVNDTSDEGDSDSGTFTISKRAGTYSTSSSPTQVYRTASTYDASESNLGDGGCVYTADRNGTVLGTGSPLLDRTVLGVAHWKYTYKITTACQNYSTASAASNIIKMYPADSQVNITLLIDGDDTASQSRRWNNITDIYGNETNYVDTGCSYVLEKNGSSVPNGAYALGVGSFNYTWSTNGCLNFTAANLTRMLTVDSSCIYHDNNWEVNCTEDCTIQTETDIGSNSLIFINSGECTLNADIIVGDIAVSADCIVAFVDTKKLVVV